MGMPLTWWRLTARYFFLGTYLLIWDPWSLWLGCRNGFSALEVVFLGFKATARRTIGPFIGGIALWTPPSVSRTEMPLALACKRYLESS